MLREFTDSRGMSWRVWEVNPVLHARAGSERLAAKLEIPASWLCFESDAERRRLMPIPVAWGAVDDRELEALKDAAAVVPRLSRR